MNKYRVFFSVLLLPLFLCSCEERPSIPDYVEEAYAGFFRIGNLSEHSVVDHGGHIAIGFHQNRLIGETENEVEATRTFYGDSAIYKGRPNVGPSLNHRYLEKRPMWAIDWRVTAIDIKTLVTWDGDHPAGSSVKEFYSLCFPYCDKTIIVPLDDFKYGDFQLSDYTAQDDEIYFKLEAGIQAPVYQGSPMLEIHIWNAWGEHLVSEVRHFR